LDAGELEYVTAGVVPGRLLNQFAMDEHEGYLRVATTVELWARESVRYNNLFVLDSNLEQVGEVTNIAPDERIYSVRFMGDEAYMVTFQQVDPFFVLDLSNPRDPEILGELKLPGYSDYLHPIGENLIIGVGKDTKLNSWGGVETLGVKVALFDVSDRENPELVDDVVIGGRGSSSPVLNDHKAFRYDAERNMLVLPVRSVEESSQIFDERREVTDAAYVFDVSADGFEELAVLQHGKTQDNWYSWRGAATVLRSTYFDNYLYTISSRYVKAHDMDAVFTAVTSIDLPFSENQYYWR
jgi:uncharacterized secreted protein with C-terminal beta-propeller domain